MPGTIPLTIARTPFYSSDHFELRARKHASAIYIKFSVATPMVNTRDIPHTISFLSRHLPSVLTTQCFNEFNQSFRREVVKTELGHLFEHVLLRYLCDEKLDAGYRKAEFSGKTDWNWVRDPRGTFHITIEANHKDWPLFLTALKRSIVLFERFLLPVS